MATYCWDYTTAQEKAMKAIVQDEYGSHEVLKLQEIEKPVVDDDGCWYGSKRLASMLVTGC